MFDKVPGYTQFVRLNPLIVLAIVVLFVPLSVLLGGYFPLWYIAHGFLCFMGGCAIGESFINFYDKKGR